MSIHGVDVIRCGEVCGVVVVMEKVISGWRGGEGGEAMLAVVGKVVRMALFVEMWVWLGWWKCGWWLALWRR